MAAPLFHPQSWYFYTQDWTEEIDKKFIAVLEAQAKLGNMVHSKIDALFIAREEVNDTFGTNFPLYIFRQRLYKLSNRYVVFKKITGYSGVARDKDANVIRASLDCWLTWIKHQALVNEEVIEISSDDDDDPTNGHNGLRIIVENDEDEKVEKEDKPSPKSPPDTASSIASCCLAKTLKYTFV
ncbi:hypothetical protein BUALT_Bualt05G0133900 [Buddleja alternifolia]|uniref:Myb/SANT-like domain-containing protein n=1 Tax=Buddleja alternifolia TaxID=168488 RepID=A0AAV6XIY9_9LAMI|nr:hypothetical protein BUALT_Bualt05G0133900 [Buddleja alternifolia]